MTHARHPVARPFFFLFVSCLLALSSMIALPSVASAATASTPGSISAADPLYVPNAFPCGDGSASAHYKVISAKMLGTTPGTLTATVTPNGFKVAMAVYEGNFQVAEPRTNCYSTEYSTSPGAAVSYSVPLVPLNSGFTDKTFVFVVSGATAADVGNFNISVTASTASAVQLTTVAPPVVVDTTKPVLSLPSNSTHEATGSNGRTVSYVATANDNVDGALTPTCSPASGSTFAIGATTVNCSATDAAGNTKTGSFTITVQDTTGPTITVPANISQEATGPGGAVATYTVSASDPVDGSRPVTCSPASGATFPLGATTVSCSSADTRNNQATKTFTVTVVDTTAPSLFVAGTVTASATSAAGAVVTYSPSATDLVDGTRPVTCSPTSGSTFQIGRTTVTCSTIDTRNNLRARGFEVVVSEGTLATSGSITITGTPKVGETLNATSTVTTTPAAAATAGQWLRNGTPIASATGSSYTLTGDDLNANISYRQRDTLPGYTTASTTSNTLGPVDLGTISVPTPPILGEARVGETLTTSLGTVSPSGVDIGYEWFAGADSLGTGDSYTVKPADIGKNIVLKITGTKQFYASSSKQSAATQTVVAGEFDSTGAVSVTGSPKVGQTLTATSTIATTPTSDAPTGQWFRGATPIDGATQLTYEPTNDDVSFEVTYQETRTLTGYEPLVTTSAPTASITGGIITLADPTVSGNAVVDQVLTATPGSVAPAGAAVDLTWNVDGVANGATGTTYTVKPGDVGKPITVTATATKLDYDTVSKTSTATAQVAKAVFSTGVTASISGVFKVGEQLTANEGSVVPAPDSYSYQWLAGNAPIDGATSKTFTLTKAQKDASITVKVTAIRAGYVDVSDTSDASAKVVTNVAPDVTLKLSADKLRLGGATTLTWTSGDAVALVASGSWSGVKAGSGSETITPPTTGTQIYTLTATNGSGTTTAQASVEVGLPSASLTLKARKTVKAGRKLTVSTSGLAPREAYIVRLGGKKIATGKATATGKVKRAVRVPSSTKAGNRLLRVTGSLADRTGTLRIKVTKTKAPSITLRDSKVRASDDQRVTVRNLRPHEKVTVTYKGERISPASARANAKGVYTLSFDVDAAWGRKTVTAKGALSHRSASAQFTVVNRCPQGGYYCR